MSADIILAIAVSVRWPTNIRRSFVARQRQLCVNCDWFVNGKWQILTPKELIPLNRSPEMSQVITSVTPYTRHNFGANPSTKVSFEMSKL